MRFNFSDILKAPRIGFSAKKIWVATIGLLIGTVLYAIMSYFAFMLAVDWDYIAVWRTFKYIPVPIIGETHLTWVSWIIWGLGIAFFIGSIFISIGAISKLTLEQLRGDEFYEVTDAVKHSFKQWKAILCSPIVLMIFIIALVLVGFICGLIGRIPYIGQLLAGIFFIPVAFGAIFVVYLTIVWFVNLIMGPAIAGAGESDVFDTLFEVFSCLNDQTWRVVLWEVLVAFFAIVGTGVLAWIVKKGLILMQWGCGIWAGPREWWIQMWNTGLCYLPPCPTIKWLENIVSFITPQLLIAAPAWPACGWPEAVGGFLVGLSFYFLGFFVLAYGISIWGAGQTLIYTVLVKMKDEKNLLEKVEEEFEEEKITEEEKKEPEEDTVKEEKKSKEKKQ